MTTADQHFPETAVAGAAADLPAAPLAALADNALSLADTTGLTRRDFLRDRAKIWEQLASSATPACAQAYRAVAVVCREEAHLLVACRQRHAGAPAGITPAQQEVDEQFPGGALDVLITRA